MNSKYSIDGKKITVFASEEFGFSSSIKVGKLPNGQWVIIKDRKSRIIMKDGHLIKEQAKIIIDMVDAKKVCMGTTAPVCSKTKLFLEELDIDVFSLEKIL